MALPAGGIKDYTASSNQIVEYVRYTRLSDYISESASPNGAGTGGNASAYIPLFRRLPPVLIAQLING